MWAAVKKAIQLSLCLRKSWTCQAGQQCVVMRERGLIILLIHGFLGAEIVSHGNLYVLE